MQHILQHQSLQAGYVANFQARELAPGEYRRLMNSAAIMAWNRSYAHLADDNLLP